MKVLLISEKTLKTDSLINDNVDPAYIYPAIQVAQDQGLQSIIGTKLYKRICDNVAGLPGSGIDWDSIDWLDSSATPAHMREYKINISPDISDQFGGKRIIGEEIFVGFPSADFGYCSIAFRTLGAGAYFPLSQFTSKENQFTIVCGNVAYTFLVYNVDGVEVEPGSSLTAEYKTLLDEYITPYLEYQVMTDIQIPLAYKFRNLGMNQATDDHTNNPSLRDIQYLVNYYGDKAKFYSNRLYDYLVANCGTYKEFKKKDSCADIMSSKQSYKTSIVL